MESVQCYGRKKTATAVAHCKRGNGLIKINGKPLELIEPEILKFKVYEPIILLGSQTFAGVDIRVRVKGGGSTSQIYAIRQAIAKSIVAYNQKCFDFIIRLLIILFSIFTIIDTPFIHFSIQSISR